MAKDGDERETAEASAADPERVIADGLDLLGRPVDWDDAVRRLRAFSEAHGFDTIVYLSLRPDPAGDGGVLQVTTFGSDWMERWLADTGRSIEPLLAAARDGFHPFDWAMLGSGGDALHDLGVNGLTVPIHGPHGETALFSVTSSVGREDWLERTRALMPYLHIFGYAFHRGIARLLAQAGDGEPALPPRETEVLRWAAAGKTAKETAVLLGLSEDTVQSYTRDAVARLGCINKTHAVAVAVRRRLI